MCFGGVKSRGCAPIPPGRRVLVGIELQEDGKHTAGEEAVFRGDADCIEEEDGNWEEEVSVGRLWQVACAGLREALP